MSQQQTVGSHGGVASAVGGLCQHAALALEHMAAKKMKKATSVLGGVASGDYTAAKELVRSAKLGSHLTTEEYNDVMSIVEGAERSGVWPVVETELHQYMVLDMRSRTTELDWGSVKFDQVSEGGASRRMTSSRHYMCKVRATRKCKCVQVSCNSQCGPGDAKRENLVEAQSLIFGRRTSQSRPFSYRHFSFRWAVASF